MLQYFKCGLPVIVNLPADAEIIKKYSCGVVIQNPSEIESAINSIIDNYAEYKRNAFHCYQSIENYFQREFDYMLTLIN